MENSYQITWLEKTKSTNDYIKELRKKVDLGEGFVVAAKDQTSGRGQAGNSWLVEAGKNLTFSILMKPEFFPAENMFVLSEMISVAVTEHLNTLQQGFEIKWPNDIYYNDKKIGGILVENLLLGAYISHTIIGVGLNINQENFPENLPNPISLKQITHQKHNLSDTLNAIISRLMQLYNALDEDGVERIEQQYKRLLYRSNGYHSFREQDQEFLARITEVRPDGQLILTTKNQESKAYYFKEVEFII